MAFLEAKWYIRRKMGLELAKPNFVPNLLKPMKPALWQLNEKVVLTPSPEFQLTLFFLSPKRK